jgi:nicotinamidase-related amidase
MAEKIALFIIDPQVDFCDPKGSLFVPGADKDMTRLADFITRRKNDLYDIQITMDSHYRVAIFHPMSWISKSNKHPAPFTLISKDDVEKGEWRSFNPEYQTRYLEYVRKLEENSRFALVIWPEHCIIGSPGQCLYQPVYEAISEWESQYATAVRTTKGSNIFTEHYSVFKADVEDPKDPSTRMNLKLVKDLDDADRILIAGEALSHCVANSGRDFIEQIGTNISKITLLEDCCSNVPGFEKLGEDFVNEMVSKGMKISSIKDAI